MPFCDFWLIRLLFLLWYRFGIKYGDGIEYCDTKPGISIEVKINSAINAVISYRPTVLTAEVNFEKKKKRVWVSEFSPEPQWPSCYTLPASPLEGCLFFSNKHSTRPLCPGDCMAPLNTILRFPWLAMGHPYIEEVCKRNSHREPFKPHNSLSPFLYSLPRGRMLLK